MSWRQQVNAALESPGVSLCDIDVGDHYTEDYWEVIHYAWMRSRKLRPGAAVLHLSSSTTEAFVARQGIACLADPSLSDLTVYADKVPEAGKLALGTYWAFAQHLLYDADIWRSPGDRKIARDMVAMLTGQRTVVLIDEMLRPTRCSELVLTCLANAVADKSTERGLAIVCLSRFGGNPLQMLQSQDRSLQTLTARIAPAEHLVADEARILHLQDDMDGRKRTVREMLLAIKSRLDVVSFLPLKETTALQLMADEIYQQEPDNQGKFRIFNGVLITDTIYISGETMEAVSTGPHVPPSVFTVAPSHVNGPFRHGTVGLVVLSRKTATKESFVDAKTGTVVFDVRQLSAREIAAQHAHVLATPPKPYGDMQLPFRPIVALHEAAAEGSVADPEQTALTQNPTVFVMCLVATLPRRSVDDMPVRGLQTHRELFGRSLTYLERVGLVGRLDQGYAMRPAGARLLGWCNDWVSLWERQSAAYILAAIDENMSGAVKTLLVGLACIDVWAKKLDSDSDVFAKRDATVDTAAWFATGAGDQYRDPLLGNLIRGGHLWLRLGRLVRWSAGEGFVDRKSLEYNLTRKVATILQLHFGEPVDSPPIFRIAQADLKLVWRCLERAYGEKLVLFVRRPEGGYQGWHLGTWADLDMSGLDDYLDYLFTSACPGAETLRGFTTRFELSGGRLRPHDITVLPPWTEEDA
ncbi:hypothetical protein BR93DRAFT_933046 [Coniochaeta sp. PMI_546]|nr:hypothetical protein BR93DRAFT_933046 [Coniochaeta sp. PMI_546]